MQRDEEVGRREEGGVAAGDARDLRRRRRRLGAVDVAQPRRAKGCLEAVQCGTALRGDCGTGLSLRPAAGDARRKRLGAVAHVDEGRPQLEQDRERQRRVAAVARARRAAPRPQRTPTSASCAGTLAAPRPSSRRAPPARQLPARLVEHGGQLDVDDATAAASRSASRCHCCSAAAPRSACARAPSSSATPAAARQRGARAVRARRGPAAAVRRRARTPRRGRRRPAARAAAAACSRRRRRARR